MLQPRESRLLWRRRKRRSSMKVFFCSNIYATLMAIACLTLFPQGLTQSNDDVYIVEPTPALRLGKEELTTVLLVNNENHGRYINVRPEVGLLTSTARTFIQEGVTTEYATQVVGTTLDNGRVYAQYLKKSSRVLYDSGIPVPSVVTSWVGESLQSDTGLLPQSHNDLFDADQSDWQAIDDRLLGDHRHQDNFVGNTDYIGGRQKTSFNTISKVIEEDNTSLGILSSLGSANTKPAYNFGAQLGVLEENARKVAANKVLPIGDLPTYTIKRNYEPSAPLVSNDQTEGGSNDSGEAFGRNPKLIYKKLMQSNLKTENILDHSPLSRPIIPAIKSFSTVTYYGFADFTTVVGDSVIVFSPSTSTHNLNYNAHITSIKGEATLGAGLPLGQSILKVPITIAHDVIEPTITQKSSFETLLESKISLEEIKTDANHSSSSISYTEVVENSVTETERLPNILEISEVTLQPTQSETPNEQSTNSVPSVMLSRPSDEEILRIYNALANAEAGKIKNPSITNENTLLQTTAEPTSTDMPNIQQDTSNVQTFGGATTIFFEDDPFANFVFPSKTNLGLSSTQVSETNSDSLSDDVTSKYIIENNKIENFTINKISEITTENVNIVETTTEQTLTISETNLDSDETKAATTPDPLLQKPKKDVNNSKDVLPNVLIKEVDPENDDEMSGDCISTSQVFLTQLAKTMTVFETVIITDLSEISKSRTEIQEKIQPTFEIKEATKYYCIQASIIHPNQLEKPFVKPIISGDKNEGVDVLTENSNKQIDEFKITEKSKGENRTEVALITTTEDSAFEFKTEPNDLTEKQDTTEYSNNGFNNVKFSAPDEDAYVKGSGQPEEDGEEDEEIELIYKTLYTTYTYLTTFFHDDSTSISSHTEVVTNTMTSTLGISSTKEFTATNLIANLDDNEINPTGTLNPVHMLSTKRYVVPSEVENFIRNDEEIQARNKSISEALNNLSDDSKSSETLATFYTTYTYYTTIFAEGDTEIMSHTEVVTNIKKSTVNTDIEKIMPTTSTLQPQSTPTLPENDVKYSFLPDSETSSTSLPVSMLAYDEMTPSIPELGDLSAITLITDVRSSSSPGNKQIINNFEAKIANDKLSQQQESIFEDQISSESNTDADEIIPSATLLLQTSFTTFTYYTTMYSGDKTNVISRLETMTNTVTETLQPSRTIDLEAASLPITYFTTFTYWTKLAREGQITTLSREETKSNVILPTLVQQETQSLIENFQNKNSDITAKPETSTSDNFLKLINEVSTLKDDQLSTVGILTISSADKYTTNALEPTTYYTTYTYFTTSYESDKTITDSRFETVTNIVTSTDTLTTTGTQTEDSQTTESPVLSSSLAPSQPPRHVEHSSDIVLYDFKKIIDADGISTIFFTTEIKPSVNADGISTEVISSSSSLYINEEKRNIQLTATIESSLASILPDGQTQKHYKTGLVRLIEGTRIANHTTTLYQSKVIGTVIDQRYAQIIESTSSFIFETIKASTNTLRLNMPISPTSSSNIENIKATEYASIPPSRSSNVEGSITENSPDDEIEATTKHEVEQDEENNSKTDEKLRLPFQTKKTSFISPLKPFSNRSRPQFAPKKNSSATIITRSDFTPTITATPALKTLNRFSSSRRGSASGIASSNSALFATSSRRFGRPNKSSASVGGLQASGGSRNRFSSSSNIRNSFSSSSRRLGGSAVTIRPSFSRPTLFSSGFPSNSRVRVRASSTVDLGDVSATADISTTVPFTSQEEEEVSSSQDELENEEQITTESNRRQNNPLLRLRRPLNRPQGFSPARTPNNAVSLRRNPLLSRARNENTATTTTTTTKPKARTFQPPIISQNRIRPTNSLFPPRNIFGVQKPAVTTEENKDGSEEDTNENNDDSEYEDDDEEESDGDDEEENSRRRRSNTKGNYIETKKGRRKREAESLQHNRSNFRNRFRRPKLASSIQAESRNNEDDGTETKEPATTGVPLTTPTPRMRTRFGNRFSGYSSSSSSTTAATSATMSSNHKAIRPTRPTNNSGGRAQFTLREKDSSVMSTTHKGLAYGKRPAFRRPQPGGNARRLPSSTAPSSSTSGKRRLKSYTNNDSTTTSRSSVTGRSRSSTTTSGRSRSSASSRDNNISGRNRGRTNNNHNNNEALVQDNGGTITVTHVTPAEVTIPVVNGKVTEYKLVVTAKTSTEVLGPQQYTASISSNGISQLALTKEDSTVNFNGATEVTKYILHETPTTTITFTPTTIRGRKTSFSHVLPSTVYSVEPVISTVQPQISANAPLANILLSQLLLGNVGIPAANPLLALGGALTQPGTAVAPGQPATPVTEYRTHASTYVTTLFEGQSTILPVTFQGKKILTTIFDTTAQTITATEFVTDTIVTTPTVVAQPQPVVNSLLLQQLLLQQHLQQQQQLQQPTPDSLNAIFNSVPPQFLLGGDNLQELEASNNIRGSGHDDLLNEGDDFSVGSSVDIDDIALQAQAQMHKNGKKKNRKNGKSHKRKNSNNAESHQTSESSVITLYVSGRRPGEFSTVLSTVQVRPDSTQYKRHVHIDSPIDFLNDGSEVVEEYLPLPPEIILLDEQGDNRNKFEYGNTKSGAATQSLESIVGDVSLWYATQSTETKTNTIKLSGSSTKVTILESQGSIIDNQLNSTSQEIHKQYQHFDSGQDAAKQHIDPSNTSYDYSITKNKINKSTSDIEQSQNDDIDEARYNLATRIMSNGVEVIIASDKTKMPVPDIPNSQQQYNKPMTLAASTIKNQMMILLFPSSNSALDYNHEMSHSTQQLHYNLPFHTNHFITKTCLTTYTYRTTYVQDGHTTVESREKVISNIATEERNYPKITPTQAIGVTLTKTPELAVGIFPTTYSYFNTFKDKSDKLQVITSEYTIINTITGPNEYVAYLQPTAKATPALKINTYYDEVTLSEKIKSQMHTIVKNLTQVVITKSYTPAHSTSVLTTYYAYDDESLENSNTNLNSPTASLSSSEDHKELDALDQDITKVVDDIHIYATKTFFTTFTYYTTTVLSSFLADKSQTELGIKPLSTVFNYYTRIIENVMTENVPATLLPNELLANMKKELNKQKPNDRRRLVVTTATFRDGQTLKISAMEMYKGNLQSASLSLTPSVANITPSTESIVETLDYSQEESESHYLNEAEMEETEDLKLVDSSHSPQMENVIYPEISNGEEENNGFISLPSEHIFTVVEAQNTQTSSANKPDMINEKPSSTAANQLMQRLTALKPMFNAMADLLQNNFGVTRESLKPIKITESKQAPNKKINSAAVDTTHPIYIPVEKSPPKKIPIENLKFTDRIPQSLHIKPPLLKTDEDDFETNDKEKSNIIPLSTSVASRQEQPLHNGGIYIRPGEIITANSDVIVGKPNGIEYVQLPKHNHHLNADKNASKAYSLDNRQFQVTYYHNKVQHPYKKKIFPAITRKPQHIANKLTPQSSYGLRPPNEESFNKNILKPPPPIPLTRQSSTPLQSQQVLSLVLTAPDKPPRNKQQTKASGNLSIDPSSFFTSQLLPSLVESKPDTRPSPAPSAQGTQNFYSFNNELRNNEILEIKPIPQVFSLDLKASAVQNSNSPKLSNVHQKPQPQTHLISPHLKEITDQTDLSWQNTQKQQTLSSYVRLQPNIKIVKPESVAVSSEYYPKITTSSNFKIGREPQIKSSTPSSFINVDQKTNFGVLQKNPKRESILKGASMLWNLENGHLQHVFNQSPSQTKEKKTISPQQHQNFPSNLSRQKRPPTKLSDMDIYFESFPSASTVKLFSNPLSNNKKEEHQRQSINYPNDSVTTNLHNISLDQHILSHTVDVNVPPITFNGEDHDYPKQAATAVRGQIPPATVKTLNTQVDTTYKYMPLITIPANEQQVQISLTPSNSISALTHPLDMQDKPSRKTEVFNNNNENNNSIIRKISLVNDNFKPISNNQDQKTLATNNNLDIKPKTEVISNWKNLRRQPLTSLNRLNNKPQVLSTISKSVTLAHKNSEENKFKLEQRFKSTVNPIKKHQQPKDLEDSHILPITTVQPSVYAHSQSHIQSLNWLISPTNNDSKSEYKHALPTREQEIQFNKETSKEKNRETRVSIQKTEKFGSSAFPKRTITPTIKTSKSPETTQTQTSKTTAIDINKIFNTNNEDGDSMQVSEFMSYGEPFTNKKGQHIELSGLMFNQTKGAPIFVTPGEAFQTLANKYKADIKLTTIKSEIAPNYEIYSTGQNLLSKDIFDTRESQYPVHHIQKILTKATTSIPSQLDTNNFTTNVNTATTETVFGLNPPPLSMSANLNSTSELLLQSNQKSSEAKRIPRPNIENKKAQNKTEKMFPVRVKNVATVNRTKNGLKNTEQPTGISYGKNLTTTKTVNDIKITKSQNYQTLATNRNITHFKNEMSEPSESFKDLYLKPSESYENKVLTKSPSPLATSVFTLTTTTTTTVKRIVLPTKYLTNKRIYTVTTTASASPLYPDSSKHHRSTTLSSTTETTTEITTLFLTHTKINTIIDTVTSVKTLQPITITATTTINPYSTESPNMEFSSIQPQLTDLTSEDSITSTEPETLNINQYPQYLPYPSVEVVSTNITEEPPSLNPDDNSIFIIMTNNKKETIFTHHNTLTQTDATSKDATNENNVGKIDETNEVIIEYDNGISFDDIPIRDEEPGKIVDGKSISSSAFINNVATVKESSSTDEHVILGGVLIATPPKLPTREQNVNNSAVSGCNPKCKTSRNEQCGRVDNHWSCFCRPGFARMFPDRPCKPTYTYNLLIHAERIGNYPLQYVAELKNNKTEHYKQLSQLVNNALDRMIMQSDFRDAYHGVEVSNFADGEKYYGILIHILLQLSDNSNEKRLEEVFKKNLRLSNFSIGGTDLYTNRAGVDALVIKDFNECLSRKLHDCSENAHCFNLPGTYTCSCVEGFVDLSENSFYPGRICSSEQIGCEMCHFHGKCSILEAISNDRYICECFPWYAGANCQVNLKILLIALLGIGTLLFILLLFCILITCTKRRNHLQHIALAPSTVTTSSGGLQKNSRLAANMVITNVGLRNSLRGLSLSSKRQKSIKIDKRSMIKDSSSESSQNSLPYILKNKESVSDGCSKKKKHNKMYRNYASKGNATEQYLVSAPSNVQVENQSDLPTVLTTSSFKGSSKKTEQQNLLRNTTEYEGHYCEQSDRSLTVMIPRAKYHSSLLQQKQLMHHQLSTERVPKLSKPENLLSNIGKEAEVKNNLNKNVSIARADESKRTEMPSNPGALISAGFEVSAIVKDNTTIDHSADQHDLVLFDSIPPNYTLLTTSDPATSLDSDSGKKHLPTNRRQQYSPNKNVSTNESDYNVYKCEKNLIETMDEWLGNVKLNELSAEARSFDETTILASTKPLRISIYGNQTQQLHDEVNTMAERDLGSTFLLPHTHLYKPDRQESEMSGFDSF